MSGDLWVASYVLLWVAVVVLSLAVVVLLRQIGVLHARLRPVGVHPAREGLPPLTAAPDVVDWTRARLTVVAFTAPSCELCAALLPGLEAVGRQYDEVRVEIVDHAPATVGVFAAFNVRSTPYVVAVDGTGVVRGGGVANSLEQVEVLVAAALSASAVGDAPPGPADSGGAAAGAWRR